MLRPSIFNDNFTDSLFDEFFNDSFWPTARTTRRGVTSMKTDIKETDDAYQVEMELPGFAKEDVQADLKDGYLTVTANHAENNDTQDKDGKYLRKERYSGSLSRSFYVGDGVTQDDIKGRFADGILTITVPKKEKEPQVEEKKFISIEG